MTKKTLFVHEYLLDLNATQAALRAGYSPKSAYSQGHRLLKNAEVAAQIDQAMTRRGKQLDIEAARVIQEIARLAFFDVRSLLKQDGSLKPIAELDDVAAAAIVSIDLNAGGTVRRVRLADKLSALTQLGKHLGIFENDAQDDSQLHLLIDAMSKS